MKAAYPVLSAAGKKDILVSIPDFNINTQGKALADAMEMARDAIGIIGMDREDEGEAPPAPSSLSSIKKPRQEDSITLVEADFAAFRHKNSSGREGKQNNSLLLNREAVRANLLDAAANGAESRAAHDGVKKEAVYEIFWTGTFPHRGDRPALFILSPAKGGPWRAA